MSFQIEMPRLSSGGDAEEGSAVLASWLVAVGDRVEKGDVIAELETDKATVELEAPASGTITEFSVAAGTEDVVPGTVLGIIDVGDAASAEAVDDGSVAAEPASEKSEPGAAPVSASVSAPAPAPVSASAPVPAAAPAPISETGGAERIATPLARRVAADQGIDLSAIEGTGSRGRIVQADVMRATPGASDRPAGEAAAEAEVDASQSAQPVASEAAIHEGVEIVRLSAMRKTIARRLTESKQEVPHFYLRVRCSMDSVMALRSRMNAQLAEEGRGVKLSVNDFILRAAALGLRDVPAANVRFMGDVMHQLLTVDLSVAVATEGGLVTPVVKDADRLGLVGISETVTELAGRAREGKLRPEEYQGGSMTISNLGMYGIETVYPILNPPQACILGVGAAEAQPVVRDGEIAVGQIAGITLAADHRAVDGAVGAQLLAAIRERVEDPMGMML
ncbi:MAG: dihydrolipoamide acetyltransferase family protein [Myxococcota bacterium]